VKGVSADGGGVYSTGILTLRREQVSFNSAAHAGGGVYTNGHARIVDSVIAGNTAHDKGAGIQAPFGQLDVSSSAVLSNNTTPAGTGGGVNGFYASIMIADSTINGNSVKTGSGGGIYAIETPLNLTHVTVTGNQAAYRGGLDASLASSTIEGTILA